MTTTNNDEKVIYYDVDGYRYVDIDSYQKLREEVELWKKEAHNRLNEIVNDTWFKKFEEAKKEIQLRNKLLKEAVPAMKYFGNEGECNLPTKYFKQWIKQVEGALK